jgi:hypothetical protein
VPCVLEDCAVTASLRFEGREAHDAPQGEWEGGGYSLEEGPGASRVYVYKGIYIYIRIYI